VFVCASSLVPQEGVSMLWIYQQTQYQDIQSVMGTIAGSGRERERENEYKYRISLAMRLPIFSSDYASEFLFR
jgi:hypothetical protein